MARGKESSSAGSTPSNDVPSDGIAVEQVGARLRETRKAKGMSARAVASRAEVSPAYLSRLESDRVSPTLSTLIRIANALGEPLARIFDDADTAGPVVRAHERRTVVSRGAVDSLLSPSRDGRLEVLETVAEAGADSGVPYTHWGEEECVVVLEGRCEVTVADDVFVLDPGDAITFSCRLPHKWRNPGSTPMRVLWVITPGGGTGVAP